MPGLPKKYMSMKGKTLKQRWAAYYKVHPKGGKKTGKKSSKKKSSNPRGGGRTTKRAKTFSLTRAVTGLWAVWRLLQPILEAPSDLKGPAVIFNTTGIVIPGFEGRLGESPQTLFGGRFDPIAPLITFGPLVGTELVKKQLRDSGYQSIVNKPLFGPVRL